MGYMGIIEDFYQQRTMRLGVYEQFKQRDSCWSFIQLLDYLKLALLDEAKELMGLFQSHYFSLKSFFLFGPSYHWRIYFFRGGGYVCGLLDHGRFPLGGKLRRVRESEHPTTAGYATEAGDVGHLG